MKYRAHRTVTPSGRSNMVEIVDISDSLADNDEVVVVSATPSCRTGKVIDLSRESSYSDNEVICWTEKVIDLSRESSYSDDEVKLLGPVPKRRSTVYRGESSKSKAEKSRNLFMCDICVDEKPVSDLFRILGCNHSYCTRCIDSYVASKLQVNITAINCPVDGCTGFLEPQHCQSILPKQVFDRWGDALCESMLLASEKFYCPFKDCSALLIYEKEEKNGCTEQSECPFCHRLFCAQCSVPWHSEMTCEEFKRLGNDERSSDDIMLRNLAKNEKWMRCSKCKFYVEKSEGCLFMRCRCGHTFCYNCGAKIKTHYCYSCKH